MQSVLFFNITAKISHNKRLHRTNVCFHFCAKIRTKAAIKNLHDELGVIFSGEVLAFQIKQISEHGTSNPIVARLSVQTSQLLNFSKLKKDQKDRVLGLYNSEVQPRLLECDVRSQQISSEILEVANSLTEKGFVTQSQGRVIEVPNLLRLEQRLEHFLY